MATEVFPWREAPPGDYAVIGDPIAHTKSPAMHHEAYEVLGLDLKYRAIHVPVGEVPQALEHLRSLGYRGVNVTVPHKAAALAWAKEPDLFAREAGAANTLNLITGAATNSDGTGFRFPLTTLRPTPRRTLLLGAGGSASTVLLSLPTRSEIAIWNRNPERAHRLLRDTIERLELRSGDAPAQIRDSLGRRVEKTAEELLAVRRARFARVEVLPQPSLAGFDLIVNATPASLRGEDLGLDWSQAEPNATAYELAYGVDDAPFLSGARRAGLRTIDGRDMLARQGAIALTWWGVPELAAHAASSSKKESRPPFLSVADFTDIMRGALE